MRFFATVDKALGIHVFYFLNAWSVYKYCLWLSLIIIKLLIIIIRTSGMNNQTFVKKTVPVYHLANKPDSVTIKNRK